MLVLGRRSGGKIFINDDIVITVLKIDNFQVKIGIDAPPDKKIWREEIYEEIKKQNLSK